MNKFWNWTNTKTENEHDVRELRLEGTIAEESWFDDDVTPKVFRNELLSGTGPITVFINSPGGDCVAASQIYTMLMEYPDDVTVKIDGMAASAASVIAMAGTSVLMAPTAIMMVHNPLTMAFGDRDDMKQAIKMLDEVKESIVNAYEIKTGLKRDELSKLMDNETWMNAKKAMELGFCDGILGNDVADDSTGYVFNRMTAVNSLIKKLQDKQPKRDGVPANELYKRLNRIKY